MEAAKKLQLYFIGMQREDQPSRAEMLQKVLTNHDFNCLRSTDAPNLYGRPIYSARHFYDVRKSQPWRKN